MNLGSSCQYLHAMAHFSFGYIISNREMLSNLPVSLSLMSLFVLAVLLFYAACLLLRDPQRMGWGSKTLPVAPLTMFQNIIRMQTQKGVTKLYQMYDLFQSFKESDLGRTQYGATFELAMPSRRKFIYSSDYQLARLYLQGDPDRGILEHEKSQFIHLVNFLDRDVYSIISLPTHHKRREAAKKAMAPSFSTQNLYSSWPYLQEALLKEFRAFRALQQRDELLDVRENILLFLLRLLGLSAFGVEFTSDDTEGPDTINGKEYLRCQLKALSERMKEVSLPFRPYMFWDRDVAEGVAACKTLKRIAQKIADLHRARIADPSGAGDGGRERRRHFLVDAVVKHPYESENARLADINILTFGGHDTTAYTLCFFLMEVSRRPEVCARLQAELATVMPKEPLGGRGPAGAEDGEGQQQQQQQQQLRHGDQKLLSALCGLEYLNQCLRESMRLWPTTANGSARLLHEDLHWNGLVFPKGSSIRAHNFSMFRESWIDRPLEFLPERWAADNPQLPQLKEMLLNFSIGKRACIGQNMALFQLRIIAAYFLHYFDFALVGEPDFAMFMTMKPLDLYMAVKQRMPFEEHGAFGVCGA